MMRKEICSKKKQRLYQTLLWLRQMKIKQEQKRWAGGKTEHRCVGLGHLVNSSGIQREVVFPFKCIVKNFKHTGIWKKSNQITTTKFQQLLGFCPAVLTFTDDLFPNQLCCGGAKECFSNSCIFPSFISWRFPEEKSFLFFSAFLVSL